MKKIKDAEQEITKIENNKKEENINKPKTDFIKKLNADQPLGRLIKREKGHR